MELKVGEKHRKKIKVKKNASTTEKKMSRLLKDTNLAVGNTETNTWAKTNQQIYSIGAIITTQLGYSGIKQKQQNQSPKWKIQLERKNNKLRTDISNLKNLKGRKWKNNKIKKSLQKRYHLGTKTIKEVSKELEE